jgi:hypothetical protein
MLLCQDDPGAWWGGVRMDPEPWTLTLELKPELYDE